MAAAVLVAAGLGWIGHRWVTALIRARTPQPVAGRWASRPVLSAGSGAAGLAWLADGPTMLKITLVLAAILGWWLTCIDAAIHRLPDPVVGALAVVFGAGYALVYAMDGAETSQIISAAGGGALAMFGFGILALTRRAAMGLGDVKLAGALGVGTGWFGCGVLVQWLLGSFLLGGVAAAFLLLTRRVGPRDSIAFGPWMIAAAAAVIAAAVAPGVTH